jgi:putative phage-type endonuclease
MKAKELNLIQRSKEWREYRRCHLMATDTAKILNKTRWGSPYSCYIEKIEGKEKEMTLAMERGVELEPQAIKYLIETYGRNLSPKCFESLEFPFMGASLDAITDDNTSGYEIKCPGEKSMERALNGEYDESYNWQCQKQMLVMGWDKIVLFFYSDEFINIEHEILRDEKMIKEIIKEETKFWNENLLKLNPPEPTHKDCFINDSIEPNELANKWVKLNQMEKDIKKEKEEIENELKEYAKYDNCIFTNANLKHIIINKKGCVDYKKLCVENNISNDIIEKYRKENSKYSKFSIIPSF